MRQYRITSADINQDSPDDCYIDPKDPIHEMKAIAHLGGLGADARLHKLRAEQGSNISVTGSEKQRLEKELKLRPGDSDWFQLWFSLPKFMEGEKAVGRGFRGLRK